MFAADAVYASSPRRKRRRQRHPAQREHTQARVGMTRPASLVTVVRPRSLPILRRHDHRNHVASANRQRHNAVLVHNAVQPSSHKLAFLHSRTVTVTVVSAHVMVNYRSRVRRHVPDANAGDSATSSSPSAISESRTQRRICRPRPASPSPCTPASSPHPPPSRPPLMTLSQTPPPAPRCRPRPTYWSFSFTSE